MFQLHFKIFLIILVAYFQFSRMTVFQYCVFLMLGFPTSGLYVKKKYVWTDLHQIPS